MSNGDDPSDPQHRAEAEWRDKVRFSIEEKKAATEILQSHIKDGANSARTFAQTAIKSLFILNGGALIALPAFYPVLSKLDNFSNSLVIKTAGWFVIGLAVISLAVICAYIAERAYVIAIGNSMASTVRTLDLVRWHHVTDDKEIDSDAEMQKHKTTFSKWRWTANGLALVGLLAAVAALVCFPVGVYRLFSAA